MWRDYFGEKAQIIGIDINPECKQFETENTKIFIGSQEDREFLKEIKSKIPKIDILIDDGGHSMKQQIISFEELFAHIKDDGLYLCEDLHTSYWKNYGGGFNNPENFIEYSKNFIDRINAWHSREEQLIVDEFTRTTNSIHYYDSILVIQKAKRKQPQNVSIGKMVLSNDSFIAAYKNEDQRIKSKYSKGFLVKFKQNLKIILRYFKIGNILKY
jgi:hypothetical protein